MASAVRSPLYRLAERCQTVVVAPWFNLASFAVVIVNAAALGLETYGGVVETVGVTLRAVEHACLALFVLELLVRFGAHAPAPGGFFRDRWNIFDLLIVAAPLLPGVRENVTLLRLLRLARIVRAFRLFPSLRVILVGIRRSLPGLGSFLLVTALLLYGYAMLGWMLFGASYPEEYGTVGQAMLTLFLLLSLDGITDTLEAGREVTEWAIVYYVSYMVAACYLLTNLLVGLVLTALQEAHQDEQVAAQRGGRRVTGHAEDEPSVREQLARVQAIITDLERRLPDGDPTGPTDTVPQRARDGGPVMSEVGTLVLPKTRAAKRSRAANRGKRR
ncbi:voltage-gated sodium channel [Micromonospora craterilacus]|uniref:Voltage-gated sodium channel n=1 Tax=Micromonospora craterilacus TaxID=1655439 RepID=A0A2W2DSI2_9ACTN|nr:ion transporter [Micromonospora craterilacus]PZG07079.1 voltage-gated sodium channel [Micromonospora craterilacus]